MRIFIRTLSGFKNFGIDVEHYYSIGTIKKQIEILTGYLSKQQQLIFDRFVLNDVDQLSDFDIQDNFTIVLVLKEQEYTQFVTVMTLTGRSFCIGIKPTFTGEDLKWLIQLQTRIPPEMMRLIFDGTRIRDDDILGSLDLDKAFHMMVVQRGS